MTALDDRATALLARDAVRIIARSGTWISGRVRDAGIHDVQLSILDGKARSDCTCGPATRADACEHIAAVVRITLAPLTDEEPPKRATSEFPFSWDFRPFVDAHGQIEAPTDEQMTQWFADFERVKAVGDDLAVGEPVSALCGGSPTPVEIRDLAALAPKAAGAFVGSIVGASTRHCDERLRARFQGGESHFV